MSLGGAWLELFLLDNALMGYLILKSAEPLAGKRLNKAATVAVCAVCAIAAAFSMNAPFLLSPIAKLILLLVMTAAFWPRDVRTAVRCATGVLLATFVMGGLAYALAGVFSGSFVGGVLFADVSLRAVLVSVAIALSLPRKLRRVTARRRLSADMVLLLSSAAGRVELNARMDTGNTMTEPLTGLPVIVATDKKAGALFGDGIPEYRVGYTSVGGDGALRAVKAEAEAEGFERRACVVALSPVGLVGTDAIANAELFMT